MSRENNIEENRRQIVRQKALLLAIGASIGVAVVCFVIVALLPRPEGALFKDPLRSFLVGLGVLGIAYPLCVAGFTLQKRWAASPYFEGTFIATVVSIFGLLCFAVGLVCLGFGIYDLVKRFLGSE